MRVCVRARIRVCGLVCVCVCVCVIVAGRDCLANLLLLTQCFRPQLQELGYKLLLYISFCLAGRAFPRGDIPALVLTHPPPPNGFARRALPNAHALLNLPSSLVSIDGLFFQCVFFFSRRNTLQGSCTTGQVGGVSLHSSTGWGAARVALIPAPPCPLAV